MSANDFIFGDFLPIEVGFEDSAGIPIITALGEYAIRRDFNNEFWDGGAWQSIRTFLPMTKIGDAQSPGEFKAKFDSSVGEETDLYTVYLRDGNGIAFNQLEPLFYSVGGSFAKQLERLLGLGLDNSTIEPLTYDINKRLLTSRIRAYDNSTNTENNDGVTGLQGSYFTTATYDTEGRMLTFSKVREV